MLLLYFALSSLLITTQISYCQNIKEDGEFPGSLNLVLTKSDLLREYLPCLNICPQKWDGNLNADCTQLSPAYCIGIALSEKGMVPLFSTPDNVSLVQNQSMLTLNWRTSQLELKHSILNYFPAYQIEMRSIGGGWFSIGLTCDNSWSTSWTGQCALLEFRIIAVGQCIEKRSNFSETVPMLGHRLPPAMSNVSLSKLPDQKLDRFFYIPIQWNLTWTKWSAPIEGAPKLILQQWACPADPGRFPYQTMMTKLKYTENKTFATAVLKLHTSSIGCRFTYRIETQTKCETTSSVEFKMDLTECDLVPLSFRRYCTVPPVDPSTIQVLHFTVPVIDQQHLPPNFNVTKLTYNLFCINWQLATTTLTDDIVYQLAWQTSYLNVSAIIQGDDFHSFYAALVLNDDLGNTTVSGNSSCAIVKCDTFLSSRRLHLQIAAVNTALGYTTRFDRENVQTWPCFDTKTSKLKPLPQDEKKFLEMCPCYRSYWSAITEYTSVPVMVLENCRKAANRTSQSPSPSDYTSRTGLTTKSSASTDGTFTTTTDTILSTATISIHPPSITSEKVNADQTSPPPHTNSDNDGVNIGVAIWVPILVCTLICAGGTVVLSVYFCRSRRREHRRMSLLTVSKLRDVISEVTAFSQKSVKLQPSDSNITNSSNSTATTTSVSPVIHLSPANSLSPATITNDHWEITSNALVFSELLGEGAFGKVMKATLSNSNGNQIAGNVDSVETVVAVKMVPDNAEPTLLEDFLREITIMKRMGRHPCLLNMIACITQSQPICLVVEFVENGDLLGFLHKQKTILHVDKVTLRDLNYFDLLTLAKQIALGMEFISARGFIHRDLACRNVMIDGKRNAKIGDFGLARYVYDNTVYFTRVGRALPIRWMPPEALYERKFSSASDVWSYGILLYELVTLGGTPYPGMGTQTLVRELRNGYHMAKPVTRNCPDNFYTLMSKCWSLNDHERPSFSVLVKECGKLLTSLTDTSEYVDVFQTALTLYDQSTVVQDDSHQQRFDENDDPSLPNFI